MYFECPTSERRYSLEKPGARLRVGISRFDTMANAVHPAKLDSRTIPIREGSPHPKNSNPIVPTMRNDSVPARTKLTISNLCVAVGTADRT